MRRLTLRAIRWVGRRRVPVTAALLALGALAAVAVVRVRFTNDLSSLFPDSPEAATLFRALRGARLADTVHLEFLADRDIAGYEPFLSAAAERLAAIPGVEGVSFRHRSADWSEELAAWSDLLPRLHSPEVLRRCDPEAAAARTVARLALPLPGGARRLRETPFALELPLLRQLAELERAAGLELSRELPFFATRDRRRAMIVLEAGPLLGEAAAIRELFRKIDGAVGDTPPGLRWRIVSGGSHTLGNEAALKRDAAVSGAVSLTLLLLLFLAVYRCDWRALWIPALPVYASLLALGAMAVIFREICWYVVGLGGCITGLAVDQGIHVYAACRGTAAERRTAALAVPMTLAAATSITVFVLLGLTGVRAYVQLAVFAGGALALSGVLALLWLPGVLRRDRPLPESRRRFVPPFSRRRLILPLLAVVAAAVWGGRETVRRADLSLRALDGTPAEVLQVEEDFAAAWRRPGYAAAMLAVTGTDGDAVAAKSRELAARLRGAGVTAAAYPLPPDAVQRANRAAWRTPAVGRRLAELEQRTAVAGSRRGLPPTFFTPFFTRLRQSVNAESLTLPPSLARLRARMIREQPGQAVALVLFPDAPEAVAAARAELRRDGFSGGAVISKLGLRELIREELGGFFRWILGAGVVLSLLWSAWVFREVKAVLLSAVPLAFALATLAALGGAVGFRATPAAAFALVLLTGLAADYGIYAVCQLRDPAGLAIRTPVLLSAATTVAGAGALVFSRHPALFDTGAVLAVGITAACAGGLILVPWLAGEGKRGGGVLAALIALGLFSGCAALPERPVPPEVAARCRIYPEETFFLQATVTVSGRGTKFTFLLAAEVDPAAGMVRGAGIAPGSGTALFRLDGRKVVPVPGAPPPPAEFLRRLPEDMARIFGVPGELRLAERAGAEYIRVISAAGVESELHPWGVARFQGRFPFRGWRCEYRQAGRRATYRSCAGGYALEFRIDRMRRK